MLVTNKKTMENNNKETVVLTMDGGGTNLVFAAVADEYRIIDRFKISIAKKRHNLNAILKSIISGFARLMEGLEFKPAAISLGFPGPIDAKKGIVGDLDNLPAFRGGVAMTDMLEEYFHLPVFLNNDGDLFAMGEAIEGFLPFLNNELSKKGVSKRYNNLIGVTFGTGFGGGLISGQKILQGDNSASGEINRFRNKLYPESSVEESVSSRGLQRVYARESGVEKKDIPHSHEIYRIAVGKKVGNTLAALKAFEELAIVAGDAIANAISLIDAPVVIGGGISAAHRLFLPRLVQEINSKFKQQDGKKLPRTEVKAFNLEEESSFEEFLQREEKELDVPFSQITIKYNEKKKVGIGISKLGTDKAVFAGAYYIARQNLS